MQKKKADKNAIVERITLPPAIKNEAVVLNQDKVVMSSNRAGSSNSCTGGSSDNKNGVKSGNTTLTTHLKRLHAIETKQNGLITAK